MTRVFETVKLPLRAQAPGDSSAGKAGKAPGKGAAPAQARPRLLARLAGLWSGWSLGAKLQFLIQMALFCVVTAAQLWLGAEFRRQVLDAAEQRAQVAADGVINGLNMLMVTGAIRDPAARQLFAKKMAASADVLELRIIRAKQVQDQFGPGLPEEQVNDALDRLAIESKAPQFRLADDGGPPTLRAVVPFLARTNFRNTNCLSCHHVAEGSVNGAVSVTLDLSRDYGIVAGSERLLWLGQLALQLALLLVVGWFIRNLLRPLRQLGSAMGRIHANAKLPPRRLEEVQVLLHRGDEIGRLGDAFNRMAETLQQEMHALHEARHMQEVYLAHSLEEQSRLIALLSVMKFGILFLSREGWVIHANPTFFSIWELEPPNDLLASDASAIFASASRMLARTGGEALHDPFEEPLKPCRCEVSLKSGKIVRVQNLEVQHEEARSGGWLWLFEDITEDRRTAEQLTFLAQRDPLTGLGNRRRFQEDLDRALATAQRNRSSVAVLLFDLDGFKYVNDNFGHQAGDAILTQLASELGGFIRRNEGIYRLGGDEFTILVPEAAVEQVRRIAERVVRGVARMRFTHEGGLLHVTASLGYAIYPRDAAEAGELVAHADAAMYSAKDAGRNHWCGYDPAEDVSREMLTRMSLEARLDLALGNKGLRLHFQGIYGRDGTLSHLEGLVRMIDPDDSGRLIPPGEFIPVAERNGKIRLLDRWVVAQAVGLLARSAAIPALAVNISGRSIDEGRFAAVIAQELRERRVAPSRLLVELTETAAVADVLHLRAFTGALHEIGCRVVLDDFGSGFSSFTYLQHIDADLVKIDGSFVRNLPADARNQVLVRGIVSVARGLGKLTVAEHVEDEETLRLLEAMGVDLFQGYLFDRPQPDHPAIAGALQRVRRAKDLSKRE